MTKVVILGAGGHAHVISEIIKSEGNKVVAFLDDNLTQPDCCGPISDYKKYNDCEFIIGIGNNDIREKLSQLTIKWHTAIHPSAVVSDTASIGEGTVIMPTAVINSRSVIGRHCIINTAAVVDHDNKIGDFSHISVGSKLGGTVAIGNKVFVGIGSVIKNNITICNNVLIGAGAVVVNDLQELGTYVGVPAHLI